MLVLLIILSLGVLSSTAVAQEMTEQEALRTFSTTSPRARALTLTVDLARASARTEGLFPDGSVTFSREDAAGVPETYLLYQQPLPLTDRRHLLRRAAEANAESQDLAVQMQLHELRVDVRLAFRELLFNQERLALYDSTRGQLEEIVRVLRLREEAGESSGYDRLRAERELSLLDAEVQGLEAQLERARWFFASFFSADDAMRSVRAVGTLALPDVPDLSFLMDRAINRGDIQAELRLAEGFSLASEAARRKRVPELTLAGGLKSPSVDGHRSGGYVVSVNISLPFFDRGKADAARAEVARRAALARSEAITSAVRLRVEGAWREVQRRIRVAEGFDVQARTQTEALLRIGRVAYEAGEIGVLELLDAYRTDHELRVRSLVLVAEAGRAAMELERFVGEEVIP